ncbi:MAG TPA: PAS domain-containing protein [Tepidisphaeraceae bacterium]|nr:PAS domain-containing protein [Tepidisphaeraceae bacterium]
MSIAESSPQIPFDACTSKENGWAAQVRLKDWSPTPLGAREQWPQTLRTLVELILAHPLPMILLWGPDLIQIYNDGYARIAGERHPAGLGMPARDCWPELWHIAGPVLERVLERGESGAAEEGWFPIARDGSAAEDGRLTVSYGPARDDAGRVAGVFITVSETALKAPDEAERAGNEAARQELLTRVARQAQVFDLALSHIDDFAYVFDRDGRFLYVNQALLNLWGLTFEQAAGKNFFDLKYPDELAARLQRQIQQVIETKTRLVDETPYTSPTGKGGYYEYIFTPVLAPDGSVEVVAGSTRVITVRKQLELERERLLSALENERSRLAAVIEQAPAFICTLRAPELVFELANERYNEIVGKRDLIGKTARAALPELEAQGFFDLLDNVYRTGKTFAGTEMPVLLRRTSDGSLDRRFMNFVYQPLRESDGSVCGIFVHGVDVTDVVRSREALRASEERLASILNNVPAMVYVVDAQDRFQFVNARWEPSFGLTNERAAGRSIYEFFPRHVADQFAVNNRAVLASRAPVEAEEVVPQADGPHTYISIKIPLFDGEGNAYAVCGISTDITERKRAEDARRASEIRLRLTADAIPALVAYVDSEQRYQFVNAGYSEWFGLPPEQVIGKRVREVLGDAILRDRLPQIHRVMSGEAVRFEYPMPHAVRGRRDTETSYVPDLTEDGTVQGFVALVYDITDRKEAERERERLLASEQAARAEAEAANRAKDRFLAVLSHELRTPLTPIAMTASAMEADPLLPSEFHEDVAMIRRNIDLETRLIDDLLDLSRVTSGKLRLNPQPTRIHRVIRHVLETVGPELHEKQLNVERKFSAANDLANVDPARLQQTLWNLLKNAGKFTPVGGRIIIRTSNDAGRLVIEVVDTGKGIPPEVLPRIFDPFEQGEADVTRQYGGMGLGLAIAKAVVDLHGGALRASSEGEGKGATFTVSLPLCEMDPALAPAGGDDAAEEEPRPLRVLLVEDHADSAKTLVRLLRLDGTDVQWASTVAAAVELASSELFDVVVSDLGLPDGSGHDLIRQLLRERPVRGIAMSGYGMEDDIRQSREAGFVEHLVKPVNLPQLREAIRRVASSS